jgi:phosphatidylserine decarboxylase
MIIAREARPLLAVLVLLAITAKVYIGWLPVLAILLLAFPVLYIFRDPACQVPASPLAVVSPVNGLVVALEQAADPWLHRTARRCRIKMSLWNVHRLRSPVEGKVRNHWASASDEPGIKRRYSYWIQTDEGEDIIFSIAVGTYAPFAKIDLPCGERVGQGQQCGYLYFSGVADILMPEATRIELKAGDTVDSGSSILGRFIRKAGGTVNGK